MAVRLLSQPGGSSSSEGADVTSLLGVEGRRGVVDGEIELPVGRGRGITEVDVERGGCTQGVKIKN